jgi:hypothetical protein
MINLAGTWHVRANEQEGEVLLPGTLQMQGFGEEVTPDTEFVSGLHNPFWNEREEYSFAQDEGCKVPFLSQPQRVFRGEAVYEKEIEVGEDCRWFLFIELTRWKVTAYIDDKKAGEKIALFTPFVFDLGELSAGKHKIRVTVDNSMIYPYRPDGHGVSDALGATWNGMGGRIALLTGDELKALEDAKKTYALQHPRNIKVEEGNFVIDQKAEYMRGIHFGGDYPHTGLPDTTEEFWDRIMDKVKEWGFNFIRCHSYCPPEAAFAAADRAGIFLQIECGMWNVFNDDIPMLKVLEEETINILKAFGHHPSFVLFSSGNEPSGEWYNSLRKWVNFARKEDEKLGFKGRRVYTAQSGWFYDVPPAEITGTDYIYFHRSGYGPLPGGVIRNFKGWKGKDYDPSLVGCKLPVICHEMGQWCSYPDFDIIDKFSGYMTPSNYEIFKACAEDRKVLGFNKSFTYCSGRNQVRFLKEDIEANYRTKALRGYEYLDLHDYLGQGGAFVGLLDAFWDNKGYVTPGEVREFIGDRVLLTRLPSYVYKKGESLKTPVELCNFSDADVEDATLYVRLVLNGKRVFERNYTGISAKKGGNTRLTELEIPMDLIEGNGAGKLIICMGRDNTCITENQWEIYVFDKMEADPKDVLYTRDLTEALSALDRGRKVIYSPYLTDLDYECPNLGMRNIFWNDQMGPNWSRPLGLVCDDRHPLFKYFPSDVSGGWQWEDILGNARGFSISPEYRNIVRAVDCWNRNQPLSLIFEGRVGEGKLIVVSAGLEGSFEDRPAAFALKQALIRYAASEEFDPQYRVAPENLKKHVFPVTTGSEIIKSIAIKGCNTPSEELFNINPNTAWEAEGFEKFPIEFSIRFKERVKVKGLRYLPPQNDRDFRGCLKDYRILIGDREVAKGRVANRLLGDVIEIPETETAELTLLCESVYGSGTATRWDENREGWFKTTAKEKNVLSVAGLQIIFEGNFEGERGDLRFWAGEIKNRHKEIEA